MKYERELKFAKIAAQKAGEFLLSNLNSSKIENYKENSKDFVTDQDLQSNEIIKFILKNENPDDILLTEETIENFIHEPGKRVWIIDPIDGTRNFVNGFDYYSISIALWVEGEIVLGVVYAPILGKTFYAVKDEGAFLNDSKIIMFNKDNNLSSSIALTGFAYFKDQNLDNAMLPLRNVLFNTVDVLRFGSAALDTCQVGLGTAGVYFEKGVKIWDVAAGYLITKESGGIISDYKGNLISFQNLSEYRIDSFLASKNIAIMSEMVKLLDETK